jgi:hypothetical protein
MNKYRPFFYDQIYLIFPKEEESWQNTSEIYEIKNISIKYFVCSRRDRLFINWTPCLLEIFYETVRSLASNPEIDGALFHHMDMWANPSKLLKLNTKYLWITEKGLTSRDGNVTRNNCLSGLELEIDETKGRWYWWQNSRKVGIERVNSIVGTYNLTLWPKGV